MNTIYRLYQGYLSQAFYLSRTTDHETYETNDSIAIRPHRDDYSTFHYARHRDLYSRNPMSFHLIDTYTPPAEAAPPPSTTYRLYRGKGSGSWYVSRDVNGIVRETSKSTRHRPERQDYPAAGTYKVYSEQTVPAPVDDDETPPTTSTPSGGHYKMQADIPVISIPIGPTDSGYRIDVQHHPKHWGMACSLRVFEGELEPSADYPLLATERDALRDALGQHSTPSAAPSTDGYRLEATAKDWLVRDGGIVIGQIPLQASTLAPYLPELRTQHGNRVIGQFATLDQAAQALYDLAKRLT